MEKMLLVLISCSDKQQAEDIGEHILKKKLVACVQIIPGITSKYFWPPKKYNIEYTNETLLIAKTLESKWQALEKEVAKIHTYEAPEIVAVPVAHISKKYYDWLVVELK